MARAHGPSVAAEVKRLGTSRRLLDQIEFRCDPGGDRPMLQGIPTLEVWINGEHVTGEFGGCGVPARSQAVPAFSLGPASGERTVALALCQCGNPERSCADVVIKAWGRFVKWESASSLHPGSWVFDRGLYRESYRAAMADYAVFETPAETARRWLMDQRIFDAAVDLGLEVRDVRSSPDGTRIEVRFRDEFRGCCVVMTWPADPRQPVGSIRAVAQEIARWNVDSLPARWWRFREPFAVPHYPPGWSEHHLSSEARLVDAADDVANAG